MEKEGPYRGPKCSEGHSIPEVMETAADGRAEEGRKAGRKGNLPQHKDILARMGSTLFLISCAPGVQRESGVGRNP